jgi:hypothetical protein
MLDGTLPRLLNLMLIAIEPNGFVVEYTAKIQQIDEAFYEPHDAEYWRNFPIGPAAGARAPSPRQQRLRNLFDDAGWPSSCEEQSIARY